MKRLFRVVSLACCLSFSLSLSVYAQTKPALTVLPLTGEKGGDEETLTVLLANHEDIRNAFTVIPLAGSFNGIIGEILSNPSRPIPGEAVRSRFNSGLVITVYTKRVRNTNMALISLINTDNLQLLAGDYRQYQAIRELRPLLTDIVKRLKTGIQPDPNAPKLTVMPVYAALNREEALLLAQAMTIEIANSRKYTVFPWDLSLETRIAEPQTPYSGIIDPVIIRDMGRATKSQYILTGDILNMGTANLFRTGIVQTEEGSFIGEGDMEYRNIPEEFSLLAQLAYRLLNVKEDIAVARKPWVMPVQEEPLIRPGTAIEPPARNAVPDTMKNFIRIEGGTFMMGSPASEVSRDRDEVPHQVALGAFYIGKYEITQEEYEAVMGTNPSHFKGPNLPVEQVSWFDAVVYCNARSIKEGLTPVYTIHEEEIVWDHSADGYRLPTEAEWEYACRAGTVTAFSTGDAITTGQVNYDGNYPYNKASKGIYRQKTMEAGAFAPNPWGLYDMHGNVYEWCWDQYNPYNIGGMDGSMLADAVIRGGSWYSEARFLRSANRIRAAHDARSYYIGFRAARSIF
ncbi:MAG: formylglycine-generating enzyme family protein [Treponema sp.]|jgi:formylglycine-generating enzyme required for sulfatase activity|nr:formylglycine-generating enzyme family protein [Treponema sp.]